MVQIFKYLHRNVGLCYLLRDISEIFWAFSLGLPACQLFCSANIESELHNNMRAFNLRWLSFFVAKCLT